VPLTMFRPLRNAVFLLWTVREGRAWRKKEMSSAPESIKRGNENAQTQSAHVAAVTHPSLASCRAYGSVALTSATVDVKGTAPGMLATQ
jgi:hypothetical protein